MSNLALVKKDTVDIVAQKVREFQERGELHFPANYSPENAMKSAWLILQNTLDKDKKPVLTTCTMDSIANSLLDMVVQGLNPMKKQCYFIAYGKTLTCQRSYFGTMAVCKQVTGAKDIYAQVVYKGDEFEYEIKGARKQIIKHVQKIENVDYDNIVAAYCVIEFDDERSAFVDIMTIAQIKKSWAKSKMNPDAKGSTHEEYKEEMAKKTVINRACKSYINSSDDNSLVMKHFHRTEDVRSEEEVAQEIEDNANSESIDIEYEEDEETETEETIPENDMKENSKDKENDIFNRPLQKTGTGPGF